MTDELAEAQREVDDMLPGTPRIAPKPPRAIPGCVEVPAGKMTMGQTIKLGLRWRDHDKPNLRSTHIEPLLACAALIVVGWGVWAFAAIDAQTDDRRRLESVKAEIIHRRQEIDAAAASMRLEVLQARLDQLQDEVANLIKRQGVAVEKPKGRR